ncbi:MAG: hypothetical protein PHQ01_03765 [Candidatus Pacebacteria bacterium]|nr:hypothetical protein [Candidatus Paceibacterota bacterium]
MILCVIPSWVSLIFEIMDNTFLGTLFAGIILAFIGFSLYRKQKSVDIKYEDLRKIREAAASLLANIEIISRKYEQQLDLYTNTENQLKIVNALKNKLTELGEDYDEKIFAEFNEMSFEVDDNTDFLVALMQIDGNYEDDTKSIIKEVAFLNLITRGVRVIPNLSAKELEEYRENLKKTTKNLRIILQRIIKKDKPTNY